LLGTISGFKGTLNQYTGHIFWLS